MRYFKHVTTFYLSRVSLSIDIFSLHGDVTLLFSLISHLVLYPHRWQDIMSHIFLNICPDDMIGGIK